jgi:hypothetical protein
MQIGATPPATVRPAAPQPAATPFTPLDFKQAAKADTPLPAAARTYVRPGSQIDIKV